MNTDTTNTETKSGYQLSENDQRHIDKRNRAKSAQELFKTLETAFTEGYHWHDHIKHISKLVSSWAFTHEFELIVQNQNAHDLKYSIDHSMYLIQFFVDAGTAFEYYKRSHPEIQETIDAEDIK